MSEYQIIRFCAPTLAGLKTASLFCCDAPDEAELLGQLRHWNTSLAPKGLQMLPLRIWNGRALIYLYRPKALARDLACEDAACLLNGSGYDGTEPSGCLRCLMDRLQCQKDGFPHEIGLFLSYPPEDVKGFIEHHAADFKYAGLWKVYGDEQRARDLFAIYQRCTEIYCQRLHAGSSIAQLAVNVQQRNTAQNERMLPS